MITRRRATREVIRFIASVLMVSGALLLTDAGLTLAWQEPVSAYLAGREQDKLEDELADRAELTERDRATLADPRDIRRLAALQKRRTKKGDPIGKIEFRSRDYVVVEGDDTSSLRKGPGHYPDTEWPGQGKTVGIAGHRTTYGAPFRTLDKLGKGDKIVLAMPYARFTYRVEKTQIVKPTATWVTHDTSYERLVLSACNPLYSAAERIIVFARLEQTEPT